MAIPAWLTLSTNSGSGDSVVTITASSYNELTARTASLTVSGHTKSVNIGVLQEGTGVWTVSPDYFPTTIQGGSIYLDIVSPYDNWYIVNNLSWVSFNVLSGVPGSYSIEMTIAPNSNPYGRNGSFTVTDGNNTTEASIEQDGTGEMSVSPTSFSFDASGGTGSFTVTAYTNWHTSVIPLWLHLSQESGTTGVTVVNFTADTNTSSSARSVTFEVDDLFTGINITVSQAANVLHVTPSAFNFAWSGEAKTFTVSTYADYWEITNYPAWVSFSQTEGSYSPATVTVSADSNTGSTTRTGTFEVTDGESTVTCTTEQIGGLLVQYLTFEILTGGTIVWYGNADSRTIQYRVNGGTWSSLTSTSSTVGNNTISVSAGDNVEFKGNNTRYTWDVIAGSSFANSTAVFNLSGNIMSMLYGDNFSNKVTFPTSEAWTFYGLFGGTNVVSAANLVLPATTLNKGCYQAMFANCTSLTTAPELPATTLAESCYSLLFRNCTSLTTAPELPATTLASFCYNSMFNGCTSLTTAPVLSATSLANYCYQMMFQGCSALTTAPELPATTLADACYMYMFFSCTTLTTAPELPATNLADNCYYWMFVSCSSLTTAPALPATTLADSCYANMFMGCTSLTTAPDLPATTLAYRSYFQMFDYCTSLNYIKCLATNISATECTGGWVRDVSSSGTFVKASSMTGWTTGNNGIPNNWTVVDA